MNRRDKKVSKITVKTIKKALFKQDKLLSYLMENKTDDRMKEESYANKFKMDV